jgi:hypothetical protein
MSLTACRCTEVLSWFPPSFFSSKSTLSIGNYSVVKKSPDILSCCVLKAEELSGGQNKEVIRWGQEAQLKLQSQKDREKKMYQAIS